MNTRRYPRTLQEAFGPHTSNHIEEPPTPMHPADKVVLGFSVAAGLVLVALVAGGVL